MTSKIDYRSHVQTVIHQDKYDNPRHLQDALRQAYGKFLRKIVIPYCKVYMTDFLIDHANLLERVTHDAIQAMPHKQMTILWAVRQCGTELCICDQHAFAKTDLERFKYYSDINMPSDPIGEDVASWFPCTLHIDYQESRDSYNITLTQNFAQIDE